MVPCSPLALLPAAAVAVSPRLALGLGFAVVLAAALLAFLLLASRRAAAAAARPQPDPTLANLVAHLPGMAYRCRADGGFELVSAGAHELTGYTPAELTAGATSLRGLVHEEDLSAVEAEVSAALAEGRPYQATYRLRTRDDAERWALEKGTRVDEAGITYLEGFIADITAQKIAEDRAQQEALHDPLTGLPNRVLFCEQLGAAIRRSHRRLDSSFALLFVDLDRFKRITETLGRELGDEVLQGTARRLQACLRQEDTVARVGGDEFAILLEDVGDPKAATRVARRVCEVVNLPLYLGGEEVFVTASVGIASSLSGYDGPEHPLRDAAIAMGRAKSQGGARYQLFDRNMHESVLAQVRLETDLRRALKHQELRLLYQPIFHLASGQLCGFEALLRWRRGDRLAEPAEFLRTAEETGLLLPISWWVLGEACRQLNSWQRRFTHHREIYVSVNLSNQQLGRSDLTHRLRNVLSPAGLRPESLHIEVTESMVMERTQEVIGTLGGLRELGIHISLDDFGTGYSSLSWLRQLPIGSLKIDRSFVTTLEAKTASVEIVRAIVALAHNLGLSVVAEGVETAEQWKMVAELGCDFAQGFLLGRPLDVGAVEELLAGETAQRKLA